MKISKKSLTIGLFIANAVLLAGCKTPDPGPSPNPTIGDCAPGSEVDQYVCHETGGGIQSIFPDKIPSIIPISMINFGSFYVDTLGSNVVFPGNGTFTVTLKNSAGQTIAASSFSWSKTGGMLVPSSPTAIRNWMLGVSGDYNIVDVKLDPMDLIVQSGVNTLMYTAYMDSNLVSASGLVWTQGSCNTGSLNLTGASQTICPPM